MIYKWVGAAACGKAAIGAAGALNPDIMFLDVQLPDMSGFDLLRSTAAGPRPLGIMVSNCADHATRAFEEGAFDYLVMPVAAERFDRAIRRARYRLMHAKSGNAGAFFGFDRGYGRDWPQVCRST